MIALILQFYLESLVISAILFVAGSAIYLGARALRHRDRSAFAKQNFLLDLVIINLLGIPVAAFGVLALLVMFKAR